MATPGSVDELLASVKLLMSENLVHQVGASFHFDINSEDGGQHRYYVDLSQGIVQRIITPVEKLMKNEI